MMIYSVCVHVHCEQLLDWIEHDYGVEAELRLVEYLLVTSQG